MPIPFKPFHWGLYFIGVWLWCTALPVYGGGDPAFDAWQQGYAAYTNGDLAGALPYYQRAVELASNDEVYISHLGRCLAQLGEYPSALAHLEHALKLMQDKSEFPLIPHYIASYWLAWTHFQLEHYSETILTLELYLNQADTGRLKPEKLANIYTLLAQAYFKTQDYDRAAEAAENALQRQRHNDDARRILIQINVMRGRYAVAKRQLRNLLSPMDSLADKIEQMDSLYQQASTAMDNAHWQAAETLLERVIDHSPLFEMAQMELQFTRTQIQQQRIQERNRISLSIALGVIVLGIILTVWLGRTLHERQQMLNVERAHNAFIQGNYDRAEELYQLALKEQPENAVALMGLAEVYAITKKYDKRSIAIFEKALLQATDKDVIAKITLAMEEAFRIEELVEVTRRFFQGLGAHVERLSSADIRLTFPETHEYAKFNHALVTCLTNQKLTLDTILQLRHRITHPAEEAAYNTRIAFLVTDGAIPQEVQNQIYTFLSGSHPIAILPLRQFLLQRSIYEDRIQERIDQLYRQIVGQIDLFGERSQETKITNMYITGNPIKDKTMFFGREDVFQFIQAELESRRHDVALVLYGERRVGKTSTLYQIRNGELGEQFIPVIVDMQEMADVDTHDFFKKISINIAEQLESIELPSVHRYRKVLMLSQDHPTIRLVSVALRVEKFEVLAAENLAEMTALAQKERPLLIIMDLESDQDLVQQLIDLLDDFPKLSNIPLLYLVNPEKPPLVKPHPSKVIEKPLEHERLVRRIEKAIAKVDPDEMGNPFIRYQTTVGPTISLRKMVMQTYNFDDRSQNPYALYNTFLDDVAEVIGERSLILLFDEYELLSRKVHQDNLSTDIYRYFRHLMEQRSYLTFIFVGSQMLESLKEQYLPEMFNVARYRKIGLLNYDESVQLITRPVQGSVIYEEDSIRRIYELAAGHPYFIQCICRNLITILNDEHRGVVEIEDVDEAVEELIKNPPPHLIYLWNEEFESEDRLNLSLICELVESDTASFQSRAVIENAHQFNGLQVQPQSVAKTLDLLLKKDIIRKESPPETYRFQINLIRRWVREEHSIWKTLREEGTHSSSFLT